MRIIIVGGGQVGSYLANLLISNDHEVNLVENRERVYTKLIEEVSKDDITFGDGTSPEVLESVGVSEADVVVAVSGNDEVNLVVSTLAKYEFGVPKVVARVNNPKNTWLFNASMGVDVRVNQADILAHLVAGDMNHKEMFTLLKLGSEDYSIVQIQISEHTKVANKTLKELTLPANSLLISITHNGHIHVPNGDSLLQVGDNVLLLTNEANRKELKNLFESEI